MVAVVPLIATSVAEFVLMEFLFSVMVIASELLQV
jgi:hypothetical protein